MQNGELVVNFSERLVLLIRECRQMLDMEPQDRKVDKEIVKLVEVSKKYYKNGIKLKQIANFYNNMSLHIIESQQRLLVQEAMEFEDIINKWKQQSGARNNMEIYVESVQMAYNKILSESAKLRGVHKKLVDQCCQLLEIDIQSSLQPYKAKLLSINTLVKHVIESRDRQLSSSWERHWQVQVQKVQHLQFRRGLLSFIDRVSPL